jgi:hypothetical protein
MLLLYVFIAPLIEKLKKKEKDKKENNKKL